MYSFSVTGFKNGSKKLASLWVSLPIADKIGWKGCNSLLLSFCSFPNKYKIPDLHLTDLTFLQVALSIIAPDQR